MEDKIGKLHAVRDLVRTGQRLANMVYNNPPIRDGSTQAAIGAVGEWDAAIRNFERSSDALNEAEPASSEKAAAPALPLAGDLTAQFDVEKLKGADGVTIERSAAGGFAVHKRVLGLGYAPTLLAACSTPEELAGIIAAIFSTTPLVDAVKDAGRLVPREIPNGPPKPTR